MDINMPVLSGYEAMLVLAKEFPAVRVVPLSMLADKASVVKMLEAVVRVYLTYNTHPLSNREVEILKHIIEGLTNRILPTSFS